MAFAQSLISAPLVVLTGAGASSPLGLSTTAEYFKDRWPSIVGRLDPQERSVAQAIVSEFGVVLEWPAPDVSIKDVEALLTLIQERGEAAKALAASRVFTSDIREKLRDHGRFSDGVLRAIYGDLIRHYGNADGTAAANLYEGLFSGLAAWFAELRPGKTLPIFTLNYDTAIESAVKVLNERGSQPIRLVDGLTDASAVVGRTWSAREFENYEERYDQLGVVLVKLHGSVRWGRDETDPNGHIAELPSRIGMDPEPYRHVVLYPTLGHKPLEQEPFRSGYRLLRACLRGAKMVLAIGTSLRDQELVAELRDAIEENSSLHLVVLGPGEDFQAVADRVGVDRGRVATIDARFQANAAGFNEQAFLFSLLRDLSRSVAGIARQWNPGMAFCGTYELRPPGKPGKPGDRAWHRVDPPE